MPLVESSTGEPVHIGHKRTAKSSVSIGPWPTSGPTPGSTAVTPNAATSSSDGYTPTITIAATQHSKVNHPPAEYLTSQVSTTSRDHVGQQLWVRTNRGALRNSQTSSRDGPESIHHSSPRLSTPQRCTCCGC